MRILGFEVGRTKSTTVGIQGGSALLSQMDRGSWWWPVAGLVSEPFTGAWQRNISLRYETALCYSAVYSCVSLIASDISKIELCLVEEIDEIWKEVSVPAFSPVIYKPNRYQTRVKFIEQWVTSKLIHGNTYVLKERDQRGVVVAMYVLSPQCVYPQIAPDGAVYYQLNTNSLAGIDETITVPASEIIHDTAVCLYHPLCGISPLTACALAASQGIAIQGSSAKFFQQGAQPGGILTAPGAIDDTTAKRLKDYWEGNFTGTNAGRIAVLGDGLKFEAMTVKAIDSQLIEQLKWTAETVCSAFHVPPYMIGIGPMPSYNNVQALNQQYYSQALQAPMENIEALIDNGLGLDAVKNHTYGVEFDLEDLLRMDTATKVKSWADLVGGGIATPNEARASFELEAVEGGDSVYLQQQNYSLEALAKRDAKDDPFATAKPPAAAGDKPPGASPPPPSGDLSPEADTPPAEAAAMMAIMVKHHLDQLGVPT